MTGPSTASRHAETALRAFFCLLMLAAGVGKLLDMLGFYPVVDSYRLLPAVLVIPAAWALTSLELLMAAWLLWGGRRLWASWVIIALHLFYLVGLSQALLRGLDLPNCGCFGVYWPRPLSGWTIVEDLLLLSAALYYWRLQRNTQS